MNASILISCLKYVSCNFRVITSLSSWINKELTVAQYKDTKLYRSIDNLDYEVTAYVMDQVKDKEIPTGILDTFIQNDIFMTPELLQALVNNGAYISKFAFAGRIFLWAARCGFLNIIKILIKNDAMYSDIIELIENAIKYKHQNIVNYLVTLERNRCFDKFLNEETKKGHFDSVKALIDSNAKIYCFDIALKIAMQNSHRDIIELLLQKGANYKLDRYNELNKYVADNNYEGIETLLNTGVNINMNGGEALMNVNTFRQDSIKMIKFLVEKGINIHVSEERLLINVCYNNNIALAEYLIDHGADIHARYEYIFRESIRLKHVDMMHMLIRKGININISLKTALYCLDGGVIRPIIELGAKVTQEIMDISTIKGYKQLISEYYDSTNQKSTSLYRIELNSENDS